MTRALDAAVRAAEEAIEDPKRYAKYEDVARCILRAALPAEPPEDVIEAAIEAAAEIPGVWDRKEFDIAETAARAAYRALRAHLLGEGATAQPAQPSIQTCPKCGAKAVAFVCSTPGCPVNGGAFYG